jgi:hypothetical protein
MAPQSVISHVTLSKSNCYEVAFITSPTSGTNNTQPENCYDVTFITSPPSNAENTKLENRSEDQITNTMLLRELQALRTEMNVRNKSEKEISREVQETKDAMEGSKQENEKFKTDMRGEIWGLKDKMQRMSEELDKRNEVMKHEVARLKEHAANESKRQGEKDMGTDSSIVSSVPSFFGKNE